MKKLDAFEKDILTAYMNQHVGKGFDKLSPNGLNKSAFP
jgi:hypothetical protein